MAETKQENSDTLTRVNLSASRANSLTMLCHADNLYPEVTYPRVELSTKLVRQYEVQYTYGKVRENHHAGVCCVEKMHTDSSGCVLRMVLVGSAHKQGKATENLQKVSSTACSIEYFAHVLRRAAYRGNLSIFFLGRATQRSTEKRYTFVVDLQSLGGCWSRTERELDLSMAETAAERPGMCQMCFEHTSTVTIVACRVVERKDLRI